MRALKLEGKAHMHEAVIMERRAKQVGIKSKIGIHSLRATGVTDYLRSDGSLAETRRMRTRADTRTTQLYERRTAIARPSENMKGWGFDERAGR
jgi:hypothetical protein